MNYDKISKYMKVLEWAINQNYSAESIIASLRQNQIDSKKWLVKKLVQSGVYANNIEVVGSWYGWPLVDMLQEEFAFKNIKLYDIDKNACRVAIRYREILGYGIDHVWILNENYWHRTPTKIDPGLVINCSSEHMTETFADNNVYSKKCVFAIQSNNNRSLPEHINCVNNLKEMREKHQITDVYFEGEQPIRVWKNNKLVESEYKRFMLIGKL